MYKPILSLPLSLFSRGGTTLFVLLVVGLLTISPTAQAQTPITTIENGENDVRLELNHNGSLLAPGKLVTDGTENDSIPATGAGTRMMWYPAKAAFRAGEVGVVDGNEDLWDASNVGVRSVAFGMDTEASGSGATAMGDGTTASGIESISMGNNNTVDGDYGAAAMGQSNIASGTSSFVIGINNTASGIASTAMGQGTTASAGEATAMGSRTTASGPDATAMGRDTEASGDRATAMNLETIAATDNSLSAGQCNDANESSDGTLFVVGNGPYSFGSCDSRSDALVLEDNGNEGGDLTVNGDVEADAFNSSSDRRLKTEIEPIGDNALEALADIRPVRFQFKDEETHPSGEQLGVIAQEVREVFPELVSEGSDGYLSVAYPKLSAVLLKGVQEQQATIETQSERIDQLEERLEALERGQSSSVPASLVGPWGLALLLGLGGLTTGLLWHRRQS